MKKITWKLIACLASALLLCLPVLTGCDLFDKSSEGLEFTSNGDGTCYVSGIGECTDTDVVIPKKSPDGDTVTWIGSHAFADCIGLTSVIIPDSVTFIYGYAFYGCTGLTSITIPDSVRIIDRQAFYGCTSLTSLTLPDSVISIEASAFSGCTGLTSITIPDGVTSIRYWVFSDCTGLTSITIPDSVTFIGIGAFSGCTGLADIHYSGTKEQWQAVEIDIKNNDSLSSATIHCTDGDITP